MTRNRSTATVALGFIDPPDRSHANLRLPRDRRVFHTVSVSTSLVTIRRRSVTGAFATVLFWTAAPMLSATEAVAEPPPLPPSQPRVPGGQGAPYGPLQVTTPAFVNGPPRAEFDTGGVAATTLSELGGPIAGMPNERPGPAVRIAVGVAGPQGAFGGTTLSDLDPGATATQAPATPEHSPAGPSFGVDLAGPQSPPVAIGSGE
jgi:hypothetical protein